MTEHDDISRPPMLAMHDEQHAPRKKPHEHADNNKGRHDGGLDITSQHRREVATPAPGSRKTKI
eukprot:scaffold76784_cov29-Tisochrysis_lutea.AAC.3